VNKAIERAAAVDPEWAKREQRNLWVVKGAAGGALLAIAIGVAAFVLGVNNHAEINHITQKVNSSCKIAEETNRRNKKATSRSETPASPTSEPPARRGITATASTCRVMAQPWEVMPPSPVLPAISHPAPPGAT
jgi:cytoskeletal protein RodZ